MAIFLKSLKQLKVCHRTDVRKKFGKIQKSW